MQPIIIDPHGTPRFLENPIVRYLLDNGPYDLNALRCLPGVSNEMHAQFAQLIGYSVSGYGDLNVAVDVDKADERAHKALLKHKDKERKKAAKKTAKKTAKPLAKRLRQAHPKALPPRIKAIITKNLPQEEGDIITIPTSPLRGYVSAVQNWFLSKGVLARQMCDEEGKAFLEIRKAPDLPQKDQDLITQVLMDRAKEGYPCLHITQDTFPGVRLQVALHWMSLQGIRISASLDRGCEATWGHAKEIDI